MLYLFKTYYCLLIFFYPVKYTNKTELFQKNKIYETQIDFNGSFYVDIEYQ